VRADARAILATNYKNPDIELNEARLRMARIPDGADLIDNPISKAPGFKMENVHVMAGVPTVFHAMVESVLPTLTGGAPLLSITVRIEAPEGEIAARLGQLDKENKSLSFGSYPFIQNGVFGSNIVVRGTDSEKLGAAEAALVILSRQIS